MDHTDAQHNEKNQDATVRIKQVAQAIDADGGDLGAASTGAYREVDRETAQQRVRDAQTALVAIGYALVDDRYHDPAKGIDGVWGPVTRDTVLQFQGDYGLEESGRLDAETYEELLRSYEQALSVQSPGIVDDEFMPMHADRPLDVSPAETEEEVLFADDSSADETLFVADDSEELQDVENLLSGDDIDLSQRTGSHILD